MMQTFNSQDNLHKAWMYRLLEAVAEDDYLAQKMYFKGGTCAAMLGWLDRFSVDLDFDFAGSLTEAKQARKRLEKIFKNLDLSIKDQSRRGLQYFLKYENFGRNTLKLEASFPLYQKSQYEPQRLMEINKILICQTKETMFSHKLCALMDRYRKTGKLAGRDLYDIHYFFLKGYDYNVQVIKERTGFEAQDFFANLYVFIKDKITDKIITEDLSYLLSLPKFKIIRKVLKREVLMMLRGEEEKHKKGKHKLEKYKTLTK
ncbi:MAG: nucleotidyl transferase AbiEii/AbiGii toxin family protein [Patescibacteria group bacterium]|nr:MAG: nucleotidyl transferase AbiEii/AbiGii toxin family protein [Patescibacteria group bacterium]